MRKARCQRFNECMNQGSKRALAFALQLALLSLCCAFNLQPSTAIGVMLTYFIALYNPAQNTLTTFSHVTIKKRYQGYWSGLFNRII